MNEKQQHCRNHTSEIPMAEQNRNVYWRQMFSLTLTEILPSSLGKCAARNQSPGTGLVTLNAPVVRFGRVQLSPKVPPCSLKVMRFHTAIMVSSGTLKWNSSTLAKELKAFSLRGVRVKYSVTKRQSVGRTRAESL
ncbi:hypothetical protein EYF80_023234 [Liparis tanakae]|uniref:Uncharacterized protein n=1 Tax=Liparis tanakae TaxID=230148 RepID=A0A4Z2HL29_9TELE|nr:hypothetical protein EYF80_023234 [Liparis tanakae]